MMATVPVTVPVRGSVTGTGVEPGTMGVLEPGTVKLVTVPVVPGGRSTLSSKVPEVGVLTGVVSISGVASMGVTARHRHHMPCCIGTAHLYCQVMPDLVKPGRSASKIKSCQMQPCLCSVLLKTPVAAHANTPALTWRDRDIQGRHCGGAVGAALVQVERGHGANVAGCGHKGVVAAGLHEDGAHGLAAGGVREGHGRARRVHRGAAGHGEASDLGCHTSRQSGVVQHVATDGLVHGRGAHVHRVLEYWYGRGVDCRHVSMQTICGLDPC